MYSKWSGCIKPKKACRKRVSKLSLYPSKKRGLESTGEKSKRQRTLRHDTFMHVNAESASDEFIDVVSTDATLEENALNFQVDNENECLLGVGLNSNPPPQSHPQEPNSGQSYLEQCIGRLCDRTAVTTLAEHLQEYGLLQHYVKFFTLLSNGEMSPLELPVLLCLERAFFQTLSSSTNMTYHPLTKKFFAMGYKLFGNSFLEFCSGPKSYGQVLSKEARRGKFPPSSAKINFAVPNRKHLNYDNQEKFANEIPPGIIPQSLDLVQNHSDMILMIDGKKVARGLQPNFVGDVNLWNLEQPKSLEAVREQLDTELDNVDNSAERFSQTNDDGRVNIVEGLIRILSLRIREIREKQLKVKKRLAYNIKKNQEGGTVKRYQYGISACKTYLYSMYLWIEKAVTHIGQFGRISAMIHGNLLNVTPDATCTLTEQSNVRILHSTEVLHDTLHSYIPPLYVKQRSTEWHRLRKEAVVTGSSAYNALGLRSKADRDVHFDEFVYKTKAKQFSAETLANMKYGADNEIHAIGTMCSVVMPFLLPSCATLVEVGSYLIHGRTRRNFLEVSPDGLIEFDHHPDQCICNNEMHQERDKIAIEYKCMVPGQYKLPVSYKCPKEYVFQVLLEMYVTRAGLLWLCFYSKRSMTVIECDFDPDLCKDLLGALSNVFDKDPIVKMERITEIRRQFQPKLEEYVEMFTRFVGEFPVAQTSVGHLSLCSTPFNPYHINGKTRQKEFHDELEITHQSQDLWHTTKSILMEGVDLLRDEATELLGFVMSNSLRLHRENELPYVPVGYALRGDSVSNEIVRQMWHRVLEACHLRHCSVLCTVVDGQYLTLANRSSKGEALTRLQFMKQCWNESSKLTKPELLKIILGCNDAPFHYPWHWVKTPDKPHIWTKHQQKLMDKTSKKSRSKVVDEQLDHSQILMLLQGTKSGRRLKASQTSVSSLRNRPLVDYAVDSGSQSDSESSDDPDYHILLDSSSTISHSGGEEATSVSDLSDMETINGDEQHFHPCMVQILRALQLKGKPARWKDVSITQLANEKLGSPDQIKKLFSYEMDIIREQLKSTFGKTIYSNKALAHTKYKMITQVFCPLASLSNGEQRKGNIISIRGIPKLSSICKQHLLAPEYPKEFLQIVACKVAHRQKVESWENASPIDLQVHVPGTDFVHESFCYPEWNEQLNKLLFITLDPSHSLTNLRAQISRHSFKGVSKNAFLAVSDFDNSILSKAVLLDILDKQNVQLSLQFFSEIVQETLTQLGFQSESFFVGLVRKWYQAMDSRGIQPQVRFRSMQDMFEYLESKLDYSDYPPPSQYIDGIPIRTFESILHGISTRFTLLSHCEKGYYSQRAISTLGIENFFSEISRMEFSGLGCPKSYQIPRLIARLVEINNVKHDPNRGFHFDTKKKNVYPYHLMENQISDSNSDQGDDNQPRSIASWFDKPRPRKKSRKKPKSVSGFRDITRGVLPIRSRYKIDESEIHQHKIAPFNVDYESIQQYI